MVQEKIWEDPSWPQFMEFPERIRYRLLKILATMALKSLKRRQMTTRREDVE